MVLGPNPAALGVTLTSSLGPLQWTSGVMMALQAHELMWQHGSNLYCPLFIHRVKPGGVQGAGGIGGPKELSLSLVQRGRTWTVGAVWPSSVCLQASGGHSSCQLATQSAIILVLRDMHQETWSVQCCRQGVPIGNPRPKGPCRVHSPMDRMKQGILDVGRRLFSDASGAGFPQGSLALEGST